MARRPSFLLGRRRVFGDQRCHQRPEISVKTCPVSRRTAAAPELEQHARRVARRGAIAEPGVRFVGGAIAPCRVTPEPASDELIVVECTCAPPGDDDRRVRNGHLAREKGSRLGRSARYHPAAAGGHRSEGSQRGSSAPSDRPLRQPCAESPDTEPDSHHSAAAGFPKSYPGTEIRGIGCPITRSIVRTIAISSGAMKVNASPVAAARPVRPMRCT